MRFRGVDFNNDCLVSTESMQVWLFALAFITLFCILTLFSYLFVRHYVRKDGNYCGTLTVTATSITLVLLSLLLIPLDVFVVSSSLTSTGTQSDPALVTRMSDALKVIYYIAYFIIIFFAFIVMPYLYFYYEEEGDEGDSTAMRSCRALKFTVLFIIIFGVIIVSSFIFKQSGGSTDEDWRDRIERDLSNLDQFVAFTISCLALFGLPTFIIYAAYGMATLPVTLMRDKRSTVQEEKAALLLEQEELTQRQQINKDKYAFQSAGRHSAREGTVAAQMAQKYGYEGRRGLTHDERESSRRTRQEMLSTERRLKTNEEKLQMLDGVSTKCISCWNAMGPVRIVFGIFFLAVSLLLVAQIGISVVDRIVHSKCKWSCGFSIDKPSVANPVDQLLVALAPFFPIDLSFFGLFVVYMFICCIVGMAALGVRLFFIKAYPMRASATPANGLTMGCWLLMFCGLVLNQQIMTLAPQYAAFGNQFHLVPNNAQAQPALTQLEAVALGHSHVSQPLLALDALVNSQNAVHITDYEDVASSFVTGDFMADETHKKACSLSESNLEGTCKLTRISEFILKINNSVPFFGIVNFFASIVFLIFFMIFFIYGFCKSNKKSANIQSDDPDLPNYVPAY